MRRAAIPLGPHLELERMVAAGLTPLEAIRAGTLESMRIMGHDAELGSIEAGKIANLIILEPGAEPWRDTGNETDSRGDSRREAGGSGGLANNER